MSRSGPGPDLGQSIKNRLECILLEIDLLSMTLTQTHMPENLLI